MKRDGKTAKRNKQELQVWTYDLARAAVPYITSIVRSLREHAIEISSWQQEVKRIADLPGRPDRKAMIAQQEAERELRRAEARFEEAAGDLEQLDIFCLDPVRGLPVGSAVLPANTLPEESFRDLTVLDDGGVVQALRSADGVSYQRYDCAP